LIYSGCESKPVSVDLGDLGYQIASQSLVADSSRTIIDQISHGNSSRLYVGAIDSAKHSSILIRVNKDILDLHADICSLPSDSIQYKSAYIYMNSISHFSEINGEEVQNQESNNQNEDFPDTPDLNKVRAFWMDLGETGLDWDESTNFTFAPDGDIIFGNSNVSLSQLEEDNKATELTVEYINSGLKIFFNSITGVIDDSSIIESLCNASSNNDFAIILNYNSENDLIEFYSTNYSSLSSQPYLNVAYDKYLTSTIPVNKFELDEVIPVSFNNNGFETVLDTTLENWGSVIALNFNPSDPDWMTGVPDSSLIAPIGYTDSTFELLSFHIRPIPHAADSSGTIIFYLSNVLLANADFDPSDDNFPDFENGTENNLEFDDGELFFDCGSDGICDADEPGYNPFGTEGNSTWDDNELFTDSGIDSLFSWEEPDYDPVFNPDPSGDDFNDDPSQDDWRDCGLDGLCPDDIGYTTSDEGELNDTWDPGEGTELNHRFDTDELYWDFGLDGIEDINEPGYHVTLNPDPNGDNWSISNPTGTEGNGTFDWIDINGNEYQDSDDEFEVFMDAGADTLWSYSEE
ncbi:MAG: hypothetical protein ACE5D7_08740, partial [Fidelibacterota bacterium]